MKDTGVWPLFFVEVLTINFLQLNYCCIPEVRKFPNIAGFCSVFKP